MEINIQKRKQQISFFDKFVNETSSQVDKILSNVGWTRERLENETSDMVLCPLNAEHRVPKTSLDTHIQSCSWRKGGHHTLDVPLPENMSEESDLSKSTIILDSSFQVSIIKQAKRECEFLITGDTTTNERPVPQTSDRLMSEFTSNERLILYDYVIANTRPAGDVTVADVQMMGELKKDETPRPKSKLELLIEERDAKRRRISYRKKVHTNRKTQTEILREVIQNQMELLEQIIKGECDEETDKILNEEYKEPVRGEEEMSEGIEEKSSGFLIRSNHEEYEGKYDRSYSRSYRDSDRRCFVRKREQEEESNRSHHMRSRSRSRSRERRGWDDRRGSKSKYSTYGEGRNKGDPYCTHRKDYNRCKDDYKNGHRRKEEFYKNRPRTVSEEHKVPNESKNSKSSRRSPSIYQSDDDKTSISQENYKHNQYSSSRDYNDSHHESKSTNSILGGNKYLDSKVDENKIDKLYPHQSTFELQKYSEYPKKSKKRKSHKHKSKSKKKKKKKKKYLSSGTSDSDSVQESGSDFSFSA